MKKKLLALVLVVVLAVTAVVGGTMAYLTDTDEAVNVMTLGNVQIEQLEYQRVENNGTYETAEIDGVTSYVLEPFEQAKPLYPIVGDPTKDGTEYEYAGWDSTTTRLTQVGSYGGMDVFAGNNAQDKFVFVKNTGLSDAYVRTIIAFEAGSKSSAEWAEVIGYSNHFTWDDPTHIGIVNINGNNYEVVEFVYKGWGTNRHVNGVLPAGDMTYCNLAQVYMKANATNEDVEALDGNNNGTYDILVLSQAIQTAGFSDAQTALNAGFGEVNAANVQSWFGSNSVPTVVSTADELAEALAAGEDVVLSEDITTEQISIPAGVSATIDLNGNDLAAVVLDESTGKLDNVISNYGELTITGEGTITTRNIMNQPGGKLVIDGDVTIYGGSSTGGCAIWNEGDCVINGATITQTNDWNYAVKNNAANATLVINDANVSANHGAVANDAGTTVINGGNFECVASGHVVYAYAGNVTINGGYFKHSQGADASGEGNVVVSCHHTTNTNASVVVNGGTFDSNGAAFAYSGHNITVNGGTFLNNAVNVYSSTAGVAEFVAEGHTATTNTDGSVTVE